MPRILSMVVLICTSLLFGVALADSVQPVPRIYERPQIITNINLPHDGALVISQREISSIFLGKTKRYNNVEVRIFYLPKTHALTKDLAWSLIAVAPYKLSAVIDGIDGKTIMLVPNENMMVKKLLTTPNSFGYVSDETYFGALATSKDLRRVIIDR